MGLAVVVKNILIYGTIAFLLFFVAYRPESAADIARMIWSLW